MNGCCAGHDVVRGDLLVFDSHVMHRCGDAAAHPSVAHFEAFWTAAFTGFLRYAEPSERIVFAPELLPAAIHYARTVPGPDGTTVEDGDRWEQATVLIEIACRCYQIAESAAG